MKILLVDDQVLFRESLHRLIQSHPDLEVVGEAIDVQSALIMTRAQRPDVILMDSALPDGTGLEATEAILAEQPSAKIIFLTVHDDDNRLFAAIRAGAKGYLLKNVRANALLAYIDGVAHGDAPLSPPLGSRLLDEFRRLAPQMTGDEDAAGLTSREREVLELLATGASNRTIAEHLVVTESTIKKHVRSLFAKLHLRTRRDAANYLRTHLI